MLGLAASHLTRSSDVDYSSQALSHRVHSIKLLRDRIAQPCRSKAEGDALFATAMVLTQQAAFMDDAMVELLVMTRGCNIIASTVMPSFQDSAFRTFTLEGHVGDMLKFIGAKGTCEPSEETVSGFLNSVDLMRPLCQGETELKYLATLEKIANMSTASLLEGEETPTTANPHGYVGYRPLHEVAY
jgi:hypothetical protein